MRRLNFCIACLAGACASCAPLPVTYYQPSADAAQVVQARCDQAPPYKALFTSEELKVGAEFDGTRVTISFYPIGSSRVAIDPSLIIAETDGVATALTDFRYWQAGSTTGEVRPALGPLDVETKALYLSAKVKPGDPKTLLLKIPSVEVAGHSEPGRTVRFDQQKKVMIRFLVINC